MYDPVTNAYCVGGKWISATEIHLIGGTRMKKIGWVDINNPANRGEVIVEDEKSGGKKASKLARFDLIPPEAEWALAEHYGKGCEKYDARNWEKGYKWGLSVAAMRRHLNQWVSGESFDPETDSHHLIAVAWHAFALFTYELRGLGTDDIRLTRKVG